MRSSISSIKIAERKKATAAAAQEQLEKAKSALGGVRTDRNVGGALPRASKPGEETSDYLKTDFEKVLEAAAAAAAAKIDTTHLAETPYERLVGREQELKRLDAAWESPTINVFSLVAEGGAGKSALVNEWLARMQAENYRGADAVLGW